MKKALSSLGLAAVVGLAAVTGVQAQPTTWHQGFEGDTSGWEDSTNGWYGSIERVPSGEDGITSSEGDYHAVVEEDANSAPFSRFDGFRDEWSGDWTAEIDVYLDPAWDLGTGFDYSVAATGTQDELLAMIGSAVGLTIAAVSGRAYLKTR